MLVRDEHGEYWADVNEYQFQKEYWEKKRGEPYPHEILEHHLVMSMVEPDIMPPITSVHLTYPEKN